MISLLAGDVVDRIAAGEVLERPASAVKELIENAFDAGANAVQVELEDGGLKRITICDDGSGMNRRDTERCVLRHATSKLKSALDLDNIRTLGFRGEALSSIASVSDMVIATRPHSEEVGTRLRIRAGEVVSIDEYGGPGGTTVDIRDLFFNTPARRKFMRAPATEQAHAVEASLRVALGSRRGGVTVTAGERRLLDIPEDQTEPERVKAALGPRARDLIALNCEADGVKITGYVAPLDVTRADTKSMWFFVNGRFVRERMLQRAAIEVFRSDLPRGRFPLVAVFVDVDPSAVDVNVHPQKLEVRFSDSALVYRVLVAAFTRLFTEGAFHQRDAFPAERDAFVRRAVEQFEHNRAPAAYASSPQRGGNPRVKEAGSYQPAPLQTSISARITERPVSVGSRWMMKESKDELVFFDLKELATARAATRLRFEADRAEGVVSRELLLPEIFEVDEKTEEKLEKSHFSSVGIEVGPVGPGRWALRAIPSALDGVAASEIAHVVRSWPGGDLKDRQTRTSLIEALAELATAPPDERDRERWLQIELSQTQARRGVYRCSEPSFFRFLTAR